jgi:hypothetical protein
MTMSRLVRSAFVAAFLVCALGGCTTPPPAQPSERSLYQRIGGKAAIVAIVDDAIGHIRQTLASTGASAAPSRTT